MCRALSLILVCFAALAQSPEQLFHDAVAAQQRGDVAVAIAKYLELIQLRPDVLEAHANLGAALAASGKYDEAIQQYRAALTLQPGNTALRLNLALAYYKSADFATAAQELGSLSKAEPADVRIATLLGDCYARLGRNDDAIRLLTPVESAHPDDLGVAWTLGTVLIGAGRAHEGLRRVEAVAERGNSAEAYLLAAQTHLGLNEFERARALADAALRLNPQLPGLYSVSGRIRQYLGDYPGAKADLEKALAANAADFDAHVTLAAVLNADRDLDGAQMHAERALAITPSSPLARYELARVERSRGNIAAAVGGFEKVVQMEPDWLSPHIELAALYYRLNRPADGQRERAIVDKLNEQGKKTGPNAVQP